jgi:hypothetical protein
MLKAGLNPLAPDLMSPQERRLELCQLLALGLLRLRMSVKYTSENNALSERFRLHNSDEPCGRDHDETWRFS